MKHSSVLKLIIGFCLMASFAMAGSRQGGLNVPLSLAVADLSGSGGTYSVTYRDTYGNVIPLYDTSRNAYSSVTLTVGAGATAGTAYQLLNTNCSGAGHPLAGLPSNAASVSARVLTGSASGLSMAFNTGGTTDGTAGTAGSGINTGYGPLSNAPFACATGTAFNLGGSGTFSIAGGVTLVNVSGGSGLTATVNQGTAGASAWPVIPSPYGAALSNFEFAGVSGAVTFNVTFLNSHFVKVGTLVSYSVPVANPGTQAGVTFATIAGGSLPTGAVYALVRTSGNAYFDSGAASGSDFTTNTTYAPILFATPDYVMFGGQS